jgi:hypothetical protein
LRSRKEERLAAIKLTTGILHAARIEDGYSSVEALAGDVVLDRSRRMG